MVHAWYFGVDSGGSKTQVCLGPVDGEHRSATTCVTIAHGSHALQRGPRAAAALVHQAVEEACRAAGVCPDILRGGCVAMAGAGRPQVQQEVRRALQDLFPQVSITLVHDGWAALAAATQPPLGIAVISGTGSLVFGRAADGRIARAAGWGYWIDDPGSAYAIGRAALSLAAHYADQFQESSEATTLLSALLEHFQAAQWTELVQLLHQSEKTPQAIAGVAPLVFDLAQNGHRGCQNIVCQAAQDLAFRVVHVARKLQFVEYSIPLALAGGVLVHQTSFQKELLARLNQWGLRCSPTVVPVPAQGAWYLATSAWLVTPPTGAQ